MLMMRLSKMIDRVGGWRTVAATFIPSLPVAALGAYILFKSSSPDDELKAAEVEYSVEDLGVLDKWATLDINGPLGAKTVAAVKARLDKQTMKPSILDLKSGGGTEEAAVEIANIIKANGSSRVLVRKDVLCASACVNLVAEFPEDRRSIDPQSWFLVHLGSDRLPVKGPLAPEASGVNPDDVRNRQDGAVLKISPGWLAFLNACKHQPLRDPKGIAMSWSQIVQVSKDPSQIDCQTLEGHNTVWIFDHQVGPFIILDMKSD